MELIIKIAMVGLIVAVLHQILSKIGREEYAMLIALAGVVVIIMMLLPELSKLMETVRGIMPMIVTKTGQIHCKFCKANARCTLPKNSEI